MMMTIILMMDTATVRCMALATLKERDTVTTLDILMVTLEASSKA